MKKSIVLSVLSLFMFLGTATAQKDPKGVGEVTKINGKYIFIKCTPTQPYELAFQYKCKIVTWNCPDLLQMAEGSLNCAEKQGLPFDAIILGDEKHDIAIRFK